MTVNSLSLNISTPTEPIKPGRGFYQLEEDSLFVQVGPFTNRRRFYSYLEAPGITLDFDRQGRLIFAEISVPRRRWQVKSDLAAPGVVEPADIRWLNFRELLKTPIIETNDRRTIVRVSLGGRNQSLSYYAADSVIVQSDGSNQLSSLWITDITDDIAGREIRAFRKDSRAKQSYYS